MLMSDITNPENRDHADAYAYAKMLVTHGRYRARTKITGVSICGTLTLLCFDDSPSKRKKGKDNKLCTKLGVQS